MSKYILSSEFPQKQTENCSVGNFYNPAHRCENKEKENGKKTLEMSSYLKLQITLMINYHEGEGQQI